MPIPARLKQFLAAMTGISHGANMTIARAFPWKDYRTFVDVGTAQGDLAVQIALANPHLQGIGFDLPEVAPIFEEYVAGDRGRRTALTLRARQLLRARSCRRPTSCTMGHILHDWDLPTKKMLIAKAYRRAPDRRRAHRLRVDHRRRPVDERVRVDDEPQHADRDAGRLRLHRRRLRGLDEGGGLLARRASSTWSGPTRW